MVQNVRIPVPCLMYSVRSDYIVVWGTFAFGSVDRKTWQTFNVPEHGPEPEPGHPCFSAAVKPTELQYGSGRFGRGGPIPQSPFTIGPVRGRGRLAPLNTFIYTK